MKFGTGDIWSYPLLNNVFNLLIKAYADNSLVIPDLTLLSIAELPGYLPS